MKSTPSPEKHIRSVAELSIPSSRPKTSATAEAGSKKGRFYKPLPVYRPLPKEFRRDGFNYRQIAREENAAIYEQTWTGCSNRSVCYEVVRIRRREGFQIGDRFVEGSALHRVARARGREKTFWKRDDEARSVAWLSIP